MEAGGRRQEQVEESRRRQEEEREEGGGGGRQCVLPHVLATAGTQLFVACMTSRTIVSRGHEASVAILNESQLTFAAAEANSCG